MENKVQINNKIAQLEQEVKDLKELINKPIDLFKDIRNYNDVCIALNIINKSIDQFDTKQEWRYHQIKNIQKLFNQGKTNNHYYPYFNKLGSGLVFYFSGDGVSYFCSGQVSLYNTKEISDFIGNLFIDIYTDLTD